MEEEEDDDDIYAPDESIGIPAQPAAPALALSTFEKKKKVDDLEEGEEEGEEMEEDYGSDDSVCNSYSKFGFLCLPF